MCLNSDIRQVMILKEHTSKTFDILYGDNPLARTPLASPARPAVNAMAHVLHVRVEQELTLSEETCAEKLSTGVRRKVSTY